MKFLPLIDLNLTHTYYTDGRCRDFRIEPTPETQQLLKNYRCVLKSLPHGFRILIAVTDQGIPVIPLQKEITFAFQLQLQNPDFALFTDLTEITQMAAPLYTNAEVSPGTPGSLALVARRAWATERFVVRQPAPEDHFTLGGRPLAGRQPPDFVIETSSGSTVTLTHYDEAAKSITLNSSTLEIGDTFKLTYETTPQRARGIFAEVEIIYNNTTPEIATTPVEFQLPFSAKKTRWKYYLVADKIGAPYYIKDTGTPPILFSPKNRTDLNQQPDPVDEVAQALAAQYPKLQRLRFVSDEPIPCQQAARKSLQLRLKANGTPNDPQVAGALPNPSFQNYATLQVTQNGTPHKEEVLFQVIKYFSHQI
jgi:hypothetical protein